MIRPFAINTSNPGKQREFQRLFSKYGLNLKTTKFDLKEVKSDPVTVVVHKASQVDEHVIVDDTSLDIEGAEVGIDVKWVLHHLEQFAGRKAVWRVLLAYREGDSIYVFEGVTEGKIALPRGKTAEGFGFDPVFLPEGTDLTLAQDKPDAVNARAKAVEALVNERPLAKKKAIHHWEGEWQ